MRTDARASASENLLAVIGQICPGTVTVVWLAFVFLVVTPRTAARQNAGNSSDSQLAPRVPEFSEYIGRVSNRINQDWSNRILPLTPRLGGNPRSAVFQVLVKRGDPSYQVSYAIDRKSGSDEFDQAALLAVTFALSQEGVPIFSGAYFTLQLTFSYDPTAEGDSSIAAVSAVTSQPSDGSLVLCGFGANDVPIYSGVAFLPGRTPFLLPQIALAKCGAPIPITGEMGGYYKIKALGKDGYIPTLLLEATQSSSVNAINYTDSKKNPKADFDYPIRIQIVEKQFSVTEMRNTHVIIGETSAGTGHGNIEGSGSWRGFDFKYSCYQPPVVTLWPAGAYRARWKENGKKIVIVMSGEAGKKPVECELVGKLLDSAWQPGGDGKIAAVALEQQEKLMADLKKQFLGPARRPKVSVSVAISGVG